MNKRKVVVFGRGKLYQQKREYIENHFDIIGFLDNRVNGENLICEDRGIPVYSPNSTEKYLQQDSLVVLMSYRYVAMWEQLYELGIGADRILFGIAFLPSLEEEKVLFEDGRYLKAENDGAVYYISSGKRIRIESHEQVKEMAKGMLRNQYRDKYPLVRAIAQMDVRPASRKFGLERGNSIDRYYIEGFLEKNKGLIHGDCLEIAENTYTLRYGGERVKNAYILHVKGWGQNAVKGNLETGEGIEEGKYDCAIITQTLMFIFDIKKAAENIYKMLKKGGSALITVAGISQISRYDADLWGSYYGFHKDAMKKLFEPLFGKENVKIHIYGNVKAAIALLYGLCREDLKEEDLNAEDSDYPVIVSAVLRKE